MHESEVDFLKCVAVLVAIVTDLILTNPVTTPTRF
jgi:hypothetical protein